MIYERELDYPGDTLPAPTAWPKSAECLICWVRFDVEKRDLLMAKMLHVQFEIPWTIVASIDE
jgi:hypothetical protein